MTLVGHSGDPIFSTAALLRSGAVLAIKGIGGYHLAVDACSESAVALLRGRKHREDRPFAVMVSSLAAARALCSMGPEEVALLTSPARPIVILDLLPDSSIAPSVAPRSPNLGVMLPYTPLHHLLLEAFGGPLVMTSGNASDEPIAFEDADALRRLSGIADAFLTHDRPIRTRVDDSVMRIVAGRVMPIRRSRGYAPTPITLPFTATEPILAVGAALKNTFCIVRGNQAFMSHHIGDLNNYETYESFVDGIEHLKKLLNVEPAVIAHDLHPDYPSTRYAIEQAELTGARLVGVQHHHAHIASCMAENGWRPEDGPVIGVAFDGLGLGCDQHAWGGEFLIADYNGFERAAHLAEVPMPGGDIAVKQPWRMALAHLNAAFEGDIPPGLDVVKRHAHQWDQVMALSRSGVNSPLTSSAGRLFDAVAAILGIRDEITYEGQAAIELEYAADPREVGSYYVPLIDHRVKLGYLMRALVEDLEKGVSVSVISARFHNAMADLTLTICRHLRELQGISVVALSGGVFQSSLLTQGCLDHLGNSRLTVLTQRGSPCNDGGVSLGQAATCVRADSPA